MNSADFLLFLNATTALIASAGSLAYAVKWKNGKFFLSLWAFLFLGYMATVQYMAFFHILDRQTYGMIYVRPFQSSIFMTIISHFVFDWARNKLLNKSILAIGNIKPPVKGKHV